MIRTKVREPNAAEVASITDDDVVQAAIDDVRPGGAMYDYLHSACIGAVVGETLFVHGAVDAQTAGYVPVDGTRFVAPAEPQPMSWVSSPKAWVAELNQLLQRGLADHALRPEWDASRTTRGGEILLALQNRDAMWGRSVVSNCYADGGCITTSCATAIRLQAFAKAEVERDCRAFTAVSSEPRDERVAAWLKQDGIRRVVVGHKPSGDSPAVLSAVYTGIEVISADTSYAAPSTPDGRGCSVACVLLRGPSLHEVQHGLYDRNERSGGAAHAIRAEFAREAQGEHPFARYRCMTKTLRVALPFHPSADSRGNLWSVSHR